MLAYVVRAPWRVRRWFAVAEEEGLLISCAAIYVIALFWRLSSHLQQDSWLALVGGRETALHGIPSRDHLTVWSSGATWVDQQWLAQLGLYAAVVAGGVVLALFLHAVVLAGTFLGALGAARWGGGASRATAWVTVLALVPLIQGSWQLRAQTFAYPLFVAVLWLLIADARTQSNRVLLSLPLLVLWANLHGSVLLGSVLVALGGLAHRRSKLRAAALVGGAALAPLLTPYGATILSYYANTLANPDFARLVTEWKPVSLSPWTAPVYALLIGGIYLLGRDGKVLTRFEQLAFVLTGALALLAVRNLAWFALAALVILPRLVRELIPEEPGGARRRLNSALAAATGTALAVSIPIALLKLPSAIDASFPPRAADAVADAAAEDSALRIFADVRYGDWLLWEHPELAGRILYDARFELLSHAQLAQIYLWANQSTPSWREAAAGSRLLVLDPRTSRAHEREILAEPGAQSIYRDASISVIARAG